MGKKLTYVLGFSVDGVRDVTARYCERLADLLPRSGPAWACCIAQRHGADDVCMRVQAHGGAGAVAGRRLRRAHAAHALPHGRTRKVWGAGLLHDHLAVPALTSTAAAGGS